MALFAVCAEEEGHDLAACADAVRFDGDRHRVAFARVFWADSHGAVLTLAGSGDGISRIDEAAARGIVAPNGVRGDRSRDRIGTAYLGAAIIATDERVSAAGRRGEGDAVVELQRKRDRLLRRNVQEGDSIAGLRGSHSVFRSRVVHIGGVTGTLDLGSSGISQITGVSQISGKTAAGDKLLEVFTLDLARERTAGHVQFDRFDGFFRVFTLLGCLLDRLGAGNASTGDRHVDREVRRCRKS